MVASSTEAEWLQLAPSWFELIMPNTKLLIKIILGLGAWSVLIIGLMKLQAHLATVRQDADAPVSEQIMLRNESDDFETTTTSATTERVYPDDVLTDKRPGK